MAIGETILSAVLQIVFDRLASQKVINFFRQSKFDQSLVHKLKTLMLATEKLLLDAEQKQMTDHVIKEWLEELKHWFYRAEEIVDQIATEALRSSLGMESPSRPQSLVTKVCPWTLPSSTSSSFLNTVTKNIREIVNMLESMLDQKDALRLRELSVGGAPPRVPTTSVLEDSKVYGRDQEREKLLELLLSKEAEGNTFGVVAIVGMGGLGKTTLAKMVYNDARVQEIFDLKAWVCVSDHFDIHRVTKSILESVVNELYSDSADLNFLQNKLRSELGNKKFFFVLDDVWNENYEHWQTLQAPFSAGANGSKIIVTTRNETVASTVCTKPPFPMNPLSDDHAWSLFSRHAFELGNWMCDPTLEHVGRKIVHKCRGLPLAIKTLGGLLRCAHDSKHWEDILDNSLWDLPHNKSNVIPALWLSYYHLPAYLKRCFSYCAIFPKDYKIDRKELVLLWMAENFVLSIDNRRRIEDVGDEYLHELISRSFLEPMDESHVTMHDLMHDLAQGVSGNFLASPKPETPSKFPERPRHFSYVGVQFDVMTKFQPINESKNLRSFLRLPPLRTYQNTLTNKVSTILKPSLSCLRVLSLSGYENLRLCKLIGCPKQLRYLDVSRTDIKQLPEWVSSLCNLQALILSYCVQLERLPANMWKLVSLRHLDIRGATLLSHMPEQMSKLTSLQTLTDFVLGENIGSSIQELSQLQQIRGKLAMRRLQNVIVARDAYAVNLSNRRLIDDLELEFDSGKNHSGQCREVLESLEPPSDVKRLSIRNYEGTTFPKWLVTGCADYKEIGFLCLSNCRYCIALPPLGQLPSLKELKIEGMDYIIEVGQEFYGHNRCGLFPNLESLSFKNMKGWEVWSNVDAEGGAVCFPRLRKLFLVGCPNLKGNLPVHVPSLVELWITGCVQLSRLLPRVPSVHVPVLQQASCPCPHAELPKILVVTTITFVSLVGLMGLVKLPTEIVMLSSLSGLSIYKCDNLKSLVNVQLPPTLKSLAIQGCEVLESLPEDMTSLTHLQELILFGCPCLTWVPGNTLPSSLTSFSVWNCDRWEFPIPMERMQHYRSLERLAFSSASSHLVSFPLGILPNLRSLQLGHCRGLEKVYIPEGIDEDNLVSLSEFIISRCPKLEMIGKQTGSGEATVLPAPNLRRLKIWKCEKVKPVLIEMEGVVLLPRLTRLEIYNSNSEKITGESPLGLRKSLLRFSCLTSLTIEREGVGCFPVVGEGLPPSLTWLSIKSFPKLRKLDGDALQRLKYLQDLEIAYCPKLERLPEEGLPPSLGYLSICGCPRLERRCKPPKGKDWSKIHHIPEIWINLRCISRDP